MANTISTLLPTLYDSLDIVARELTGFIPAVTRNSSAARVAVGDSVRYPITAAATPISITPGMYAPDEGNQTVTSDTISIASSYQVPIRWNGEEMVSMNNTGQMQSILRDQFAQAMRALVNKIEGELAALYVNAARAYGTGGTAPFGTAADFTDFAGVLQALDETGTPQTDRHLVLGSVAMAKLRGVQSVLFKANEAGTDELLRQGAISVVQGLALHNSAAIKTHTKGTGTNYIINGTTIGAGSLTIPLDTGSGTIVAGDALVFTGDATRKYVVGTGITAAGNVVLNGQKGLMVAAADNSAVTVGTGGSVNMAFHRSAIHLVTRAPAMPEGGDTADDVTEITDPLTGLSFQIALYRQYRQIKFEVGIAWGMKAVKSDFMCNLLG